MNKLERKQWTWVILALVTAWGIDRVTKLWALYHFSQLEFYGPIGLVLHRNPGAMLGLFSDLSPLLRIVSLSTGGAFLFLTYLTIQVLLPFRALNLRIGLSFLIGGILGNVADRIAWGSVIDFIVIGTPQLCTPAFNFADLIQWVGYRMIVWTIVKDSELIWPTDNARRKQWVLPSFQIKFCLMLVGVGLCFSLIAGVFTYTFLRMTLEDASYMYLTQKRHHLAFLS